MTSAKILDLYRALSLPGDHVSATELGQGLIAIATLRSVGPARVFAEARHADGEDAQCVVDRARATYRDLAHRAEVERQAQAVPLIVRAAQ